VHPCCDLQIGHDIRVVSHDIRVVSHEIRVVSHDIRVVSIVHFFLVQHHD